MRNFRVNKLAFALALSSSSALAFAQNQDANSLQVDVTGSREGGQSILTPTKFWLAMSYKINWVLRLGQR